MKKFKKLIALVTVLLFALSIFAPAWAQDETTTTTEEQTTGSVYDDAAKILKDKGIMVGNESGDLMLDKSLTRAEILKMILLSTGQGDVVNDYVYAEQSFTDVPKDHWAFAYVEAGKDLGIVNGYPNGTFKPDQPVKFEELCKMLVAAKGESPDAGKWPVNYVRKALDLGFFSGIEDEVGIGDVVIRGQAAVAFANAFFPPEKSIVVKDVYSVANDSIKVAVDVYLNGESATLEEGDVLPMDFEIKDASDPTKTLAVTLIDTNASDFANGILVLKTAAQTAGANYKVFFKGQDTGKTFAGVALPLQVTKVEALNYKEIKVTFNRAVDNATYATTTGNYTVKIGTASVTVSNVSLASDNKSVTLLLADKFDSGYTVNVTVSKAVGLNADYTASFSNFVDQNAPTIESVTPVGLTKLIVKYSEPVQNAGQGYESNYVVDGSAVPTIISGDSTGKVYTLTFYSPLSAGDHVLKVSGVTDYAGYNLVIPSKTFTMAADTTAVTAPTVVSATQTSVKLKFNKGITQVTSVSISPSGTYTGYSVDTTDPSIVTLSFSTTSPVPLSGATLTLSVVDVNGNSVSNLNVVVVPTIDITAPSFVSYSIDGTKTIRLKFNEDVLNQGTFKIVDANSVVQYPTSITYYSDSYGTYKNQLVLNFANDIASGSATLTMSGVKDTSPLGNQMPDYTLTFTMADKAAPSISAIYYEGSSTSAITKLYIVFSEQVNKTVAESFSTYTILSGSSSSSLTAKSVTLLSDGKTVKIEFASAQSISGIIVSNIADLAGNTASIYKDTTAFSPATLNTPIVISSAQLSARNKVDLIINGKYTFINLSASDFKVWYIGADGSEQYAASIIGIAQSYDSTANQTKITLTLATNLDADAKYRVTVGSTTEARDIYVKLTTATPGTKDVFGNAVTISSGTLLVTDNCAPEVTSVASDKEGIIKVAFTEVVSAVYGATWADAIKLYKDGSLITLNSSDFYFDSTNKKLIIGAPADVEGKLAQGTYTVQIVAEKIQDQIGKLMSYIAPSTGVAVPYNTAPQVASVYAGGAKTIKVTFNQYIDPATFNASSITVTDGVYTFAQGSDYTISGFDGKTFTITVNDSVFGTNNYKVFTVNIPNTLKDLAGQAITNYGNFNVTVYKQ